MLYNAANNNYVLWPRQAFAAVLNVYAAPSPTGPFTQQNSFSTLDGFGTNGDFNLFQDTDGSAYLIRSGSTNNGILIISKLNSDYTNSDGVNHVNYTNDATSPFGQKSEGHTMFKRGSTYFWMASGYTIRTPNANMYVTSSGPLGPWSAAANPFQPNSDPKSAGPLNYTPSNQFSYDTQNDMAIQIPDTWSNRWMDLFRGPVRPSASVTRPVCLTCRKNDPAP